MKQDKMKVFFLEIFLVIITVFVLFKSNIISTFFVSGVLTIYMVIVCFFLNFKKRILDLKNQITFLMVIFGIIYLSGFYLMGMYFGFNRAVITLSFKSLYMYTIPVILIIISSEVIRNRFLSYDLKFRIKSKRINFSPIFTFISMTIIEVLIYMTLHTRLDTFDDYLTVFGFVLFAAISCNLLYNYMTSRFSFLGIIIYRIITIVYAYVIPIIPDVYLFFRAFLRMVYPYFIFLILNMFYIKGGLVPTYTKKSWIKKLLSVCMFIFAVSIVLLVSCKFSYGILVIGSKSMTGTLNKGDAIIYEAYDNERLNIGQIIVFYNENIQTVHRIINIKNVNGERRIFTKGDANLQADEGYVLTDAVIGVVKLRIAYIGYPSLWIRDMFLNK